MKKIEAILLKIHLPKRRDPLKVMFSGRLPSKEQLCEAIESRVEYALARSSSKDGEESGEEEIWADKAKELIDFRKLVEYVEEEKGVVKLGSMSIVGTVVGTITADLNFAEVWLVD